jgi:hypothetical protein
MCKVKLLSCAAGENSVLVQDISGIDIRFYYQNEHKTLNTVHSFILYNMFRPFVSAIIGQNHNNVNGKVC